MKTARLLLVLLVLYHLTGFFIVPYLLVSFTPLLFTGHPNLSGHLVSASFNPYTLRLELSGLEVRRTGPSTSETRPYFAFDYLLVDLEWQSLRRLAWLAREVRLEHGSLELVREIPEGGGDLQPAVPGWVARLGQRPFALRNLTIRDSRLILTDLASNTSHRLEQIYLGLPLLRNLPAESGLTQEPTDLAPEFSAVIDGKMVALKGSPPDPGKPESGRLNLDFQGLELANRLDFLLPRGLRISRGRGDLEAGLILPGADDRANLTLTLQGQLNDLEIRDPGNDALLVPQFNFILELEPLRSSYRFRELLLVGPRATLNPAEGVENDAIRLPFILGTSLHRLLAHGKDLSLDLLTVTGGTLYLAPPGDAASGPDYSGLTLQVTRLNRPPERPGTFAFSCLDRKGQEFTGQGDLSLTAAGLHGHLRLANPPPALLEIPPASGSTQILIGGISSLTGEFSLAATAAPDLAFNWDLAQARLELRGLLVSVPNQWQLSLPAATLAGGSQRPDHKGWSFNRLSGNGAAILLDRELFLAPPPAPRGPSSESPAPLAIRELELGDTTISLLAGTRSVLSLHGCTLAGRNLGRQAGQRGQVRLGGNFEGGGQLSLVGEISLTPLAGDLALEITDLQLPTIRPLLASFLPPLLRAADFRGQGRLTFPNLRATGDLYLSSLSNPSGGERPSFSCDSAIFKELTVTARPPRLSARELLFIKPAFHITRLATKQAAPGAFLFPAAGDPADSPPLIEIKTVNISDGSFLFSDRSLDPDLEIRLEDISGLMSDMVNQPGQAAPFTLQSRLYLNPTTEIGEPTASSRPTRLNLQGEAALFGPELAARAALKINDLDLVPLEPWLGELLGYQPLRGRADLSGDFTLAGQEISTRQRLTVTGLALGSSLSGRFNTPLALALHSDPLDRITLPLEFGGDRQPPYFSYAEGLAQAVRNRLEQTTVAPFALLADLAPEQQDLDFIAFAPGSSSPAGGETGKLRALATILHQRPKLGLVITGQTDSWHDRTQNDSAPGSTSQIPVPAVNLTSAEAGELQTLATRRGEAVREILLRAGIEGERLRMAARDPDLLEEEALLERPGSRVDLGLVPLPR